LTFQYLVDMILRLTFSFLFLGYSIGFCQDLPSVKNGELDLRRWNSIEQPAVSLRGEWNFYWNKLLLSKDLQTHGAPSHIQLSKPWNEQPVAGKQLPKNGFATYSLTVFLPAHTHSIAFALPAVFNCDAFWVNDSLVFESGRVGTNPDNTIPQWKPKTVKIKTVADTLRLIFQIANFQQTRGGCAENMLIGDPDHLIKLDSIVHTSEWWLIFFFGATALIGLVIFFLVRTQGFLFLSLITLAYTIRFLFSDLYLFSDLGIHVPWIIVAKLEYATIPLIIVFATIFIAHIYPLEFKRKLSYFFIILNSLLVAVVVASPSSLFSPLLVVLQIVGLAFIAVAMYVIIGALIFRRAGAWVSVLGLVAFVLVGFYNIYAFITFSDLNRIVIHSGYALALLLNIVSLLYRTPMRLRYEEDNILRYSDLYGSEPDRKV